MRKLVVAAAVCLSLVVSVSAMASDGSGSLLDQLVTLVFGGSSVPSQGAQPDTINDGTGL